MEFVLGLSGGGGFGYTKPYAWKFKGAFLELGRLTELPRASLLGSDGSDQVLGQAAQLIEQAGKALHRQTIAVVLGASLSLGCRRALGRGHRILRAKRALVLEEQGRKIALHLRPFARPGPG